MCKRKYKVTNSTKQVNTYLYLDIAINYYRTNISFNKDPCLYVEIITNPVILITADFESIYGCIKQVAFYTG